jgi:hypothetical protein
VEIWESILKRSSCILLCLFFFISRYIDGRLVKSIIRTRDAVVENQLTAGSILVHGDLNVEGLISASSNSGSNSSVVGPSSSTNNAVARFSGTTGNVIKNSGVIIDDSNNITVSEQGSLRLADIAGGEYVGISAPDSVTANYTLKLPGSTPLVNQFLQAGSSTATDLRWVDLADFASPEISRMIYVSKAGNDTTGDGSAEKPFLTVAKGVEVANSLASSANRIGVNIGAGTFVEANPISMTVQGVSLIGNSITSTLDLFRNIYNS